MGTIYSQMRMIHAMRHRQRPRQTNRGRTRDQVKRLNDLLAGLGEVYQGGSVTGIGGRLNACPQQRRQRRRRVTHSLINKFAPASIVVRSSRLFPTTLDGVDSAAKTTPSRRSYYRTRITCDLAANRRGWRVEVGYVFTGRPRGRWRPGLCRGCGGRLARPALQFEASPTARARARPVRWQRAPGR